MNDQELSNKVYKKGSKESYGRMVEKRKSNGTYTSHWKGKHLTQEMKEKISDTRRRLYSEGKIISPWIGRKHTQETKDKLRLSRLGRPSPVKGIKFSEERKKRMSEQRKGKSVSPEGLKKARLKILGSSQSKEHIRKRVQSKLANWKGYSPETIVKFKTARAKQVFPVKDTSIEVKIQNFLKQLGIEFFTHQYIKEIEHCYQCDILIPSMNLVIECDGDYWHNYPVGKEIDHIRTSELIAKGFKVLRFWENEIKNMDLNKFKERLF